MRTNPKMKTDPEMKMDPEMRMKMKKDETTIKAFSAAYTTY
jgi:hypothetical protein